MPPVATNNDEGEKDLIFSHTQICTDTIGVDSQWYSWKGVNYTYTGAVDLSASAGDYTLIAYCNDTYGSVDFDSNVVTLRDFDTNATTECPDGYYLDGDGTCKTYPLCANDEKLYYNGSSWSCIEDSGGSSSTNVTLYCKAPTFSYNYLNNYRYMECTNE